MPSADGDLLQVLEEARRLGFLGPGPVDDHVSHASSFRTAIAPAAPPRVVVDLGSGGGLPGLVLARELPGTTWVLLDANQRRTAFLRDAVAHLRLADRVSVAVVRAEEAGRSERFRHRADLVVARSFAAPPVTAECAAPLLEAGGQLVVSEPPREQGAASRWDQAGLAALGMALEADLPGPPGFVRIRQVGRCGDRYPRRTGVPAKRPLW